MTKALEASLYALLYEQHHLRIHPVLRRCIHESYDKFDLSAGAGSSGFFNFEVCNTF